jgi:hypothetical protein
MIRPALLAFALLLIAAVPAARTSFWRRHG